MQARQALCCQLSMRFERCQWCCIASWLCEMCNHAEMRAVTGCTRDVACPHDRHVLQDIIRDVAGIIFRVIADFWKVVRAVVVQVGPQSMQSEAIVPACA